MPDLKYTRGDSLNPTPKEHQLDRIERLIGEVDEDLWIALKHGLNLSQLNRLKEMIDRRIAGALAAGVKQGVESVTEFGRKKKKGE